uniref:RING-type domain-containing protein n=1 Tax=Setaria italica TaxID=4555 RepID=K3YYL8_SETIT
MPVGGILVVAGILMLLMTFAFGVVSLQCCFGACHRRRAALASSSQSARWRRGGVDPEAAPRSPPATVHRAAARSKEEECAVCLAGLEDGEEARFMPCCGHGFHAQCVATWLAMASRPTCPLCRRINVARPPPGMAPAPVSALPRVPPEPASYAANLPARDRESIPELSVPTAIPRDAVKAPGRARRLRGRLGFGRLWGFGTAGADCLC